MSENPFTPKPVAPKPADPKPKPARAPAQRSYRLSSDEYHEGVYPSTNQAMPNRVRRSRFVNR